MGLVVEDRMDNWTPEAVVADVRRGSPWAALDAEQLARLAYRALFLAGCGRIELDSMLGVLYREYVKRVTTDERRRTFKAIREEVRSGSLRGAVFLHFLCGDSDCWTVSEAAVEIASRGVSETPDGPRGADGVLELAVTGRLLNAGAALGGLLALADPQVNSKLRLMRGALELPAADLVLEQMSVCVRGYVHAATVEFWLGWMEELAPRLPDSRQPLDRAAEALVHQREALREPVVLQGDRILWISRDGARLASAAHGIPLGQFATLIAPRLSALVEAAPASAPLRSAALAWGITH